MRKISNQFTWRFVMAMLICFSTLLTTDAFALEKVSDTELKTLQSTTFLYGASKDYSTDSITQKVTEENLSHKKGSAAYTLGDCINANSCGTPIGCRLDPGNAAQCAKDVDLKWFTCSGDGAPAGTALCKYPKTFNAPCFIRVYYPLAGGGCPCTAGSNAGGPAPTTLATHNTCK